LELLAVLLRFWRHFTVLGTCKPEETWKLPHQTCGHRSVAGKRAGGAGTGLGVADPHQRSCPALPAPYREGRQHRLRELGLEGVEQLLGPGVVEGQEPCRHGEGGRTGGVTVGTKLADPQHSALGGGRAHGGRAGVHSGGSAYGGHAGVP